MRICLISNEYPPETGYGGIGTYTYNLSHGFSDAGHDVTVITKALRSERFYKDKKVKVYRIFDKKVPFKGLSKIANLFTASWFSYYWHSRSVFKKIEEIIEKEGKFDIIEGPLWDGECFAYDSKIGIPLVVRLQTPIFKSKEILNLKPKKVLEYIEKKSLDKATLIAAISRNIAGLISQKYKINRGKIVLSLLGIELPNLKNPVFKKNSFNLLYVGRLEKRKGTDELIESLPEILEKNSSITIDIVGRDCFQAPGGLGYYEYFRKTVPKRFWRRVKFHGFISSDKLKKFYRECDVFIAPSRYESFGLIFLEAMAYGKPVIGTRTGGITEIIKNGEVGLLIDVNDSSQIADAVDKLFSNEHLRKKLGRKAFDYIRKNFTVKRLTDNSLSMYKQAIQNFYEGR